MSQDQEAARAAVKALEPFASEFVRLEKNFDGPFKDLFNDNVVYVGGQISIGMLRAAYLALNSLSAIDLSALALGREGWKLVPVEPTNGMLVAMEEAAPQLMTLVAQELSSSLYAYRAMLAAAPSPAAPETRT